MAIISKAPPSFDWVSALVPAAQAFGQQHQQQQQQQQQKKEGEILNRVLSQIASKGQGVQAFDILKGLAQAQQQGVSPQTVQQFSEQIPKIMQSTSRASGLDPALITAQAEMRKAASEEHKQSYQLNEPLIKPIQEGRLKSKELDYSLDNALKAIDSGNVGFLSPSHFAELSGMSSLLSPEGKLLKNSMKDYYGLVKQYFGGNPSNFETKQIEDLLAKIGSNEHANRVAVYTLRAQNEMKKLAARSFDQIVAENGGKIPFDLAPRLEKQMAEGQDLIRKQIGTLIDQEVASYYKKPVPRKSQSSEQRAVQENAPPSQEQLGRTQNEKRSVRHKASGQVIEVGPEYFEEVQSRPNDYEFIQ